MRTGSRIKGKQCSAVNVKVQLLQMKAPCLKVDGCYLAIIVPSTGISIA